ncbi:MAG: LamG domain-containing protein [Comamonadaceae bacterium]|nr:LamG domain-containing protein [Comamonadaceae bacterium]
MASARYWRITDVSAHSSAYLELGALELWASGAKLTATLTCAVAPVSGALANLSDANLATAAKWLISPGLAFVFDLGSAGIVDVPRFGAVYQPEFVASCALEYSDDALSWLQAASYIQVVYPGFQTLTEIVTTGFVDPYPSQVTLLLRGDGSNGSTTFTDDSDTPKTVTGYGNARISTSQNKFGGASIYLDGSGDYLQTPQSSDFAFPGDFTIEFWAWKSANGAAGYDTAMTTDTSSGSAINGWFVELSGTRGFVFAHASATVIEYATNPNNSAWTHWAISRTGNTLKAFRQGVEIYTGTNTTSFLANGVFGVGGSSTSPSYPYNGYIDDLKITKGVGRYTAAFDPELLGSGSVSLPTEPPNFVTNPAGQADSLSTVTLPDFATTLHGAANTLNRGDLSGWGRITGTVKVTPATPVARRVRLHRDVDGLLVDTVWSDPTTGAYQFDDINPDFAYTVLSYDHTEAFRAVVADRVLTEPM